MTRNVRLSNLLITSAKTEVMEAMRSGRFVSGILSACLSVCSFAQKKLRMNLHKIFTNDSLRVKVISF